MFRKLLWALIIFFGLYYFGNFTLNGVNVKSYLRNHVTPEMIEKGRVMLVKGIDLAEALYRNYERDQRKAEGKEEDSATAEALMPKLPLREITPGAKKELIKNAP